LRNQVKSPMRVPDFLAEQRVAFETLLHPLAYTAQKRAKYLRVPGRQVAKSVLLAGPQGYFLAVLPATHQIDTAVLARELGGPVRLAGEREIRAVFPDCEWGVVPPFGRLYGLATVLDEALIGDALLVFEGSRQMEALRLSGRDFERLERPRRLRFAQRQRVVP
jgi:Ala-tRNA(Pro) deacylase